MIYRKLLILLVALLVSFNSDASVGSKALKAGALYGAYHASKIVISRGSPYVMRHGASALKRYLQANPHHVATLIGSITLSAVENPAITDKAVELLLSTGYINDHEARRIKEDSIGFADAYARVELSIQDINHNNACKNGIPSTYLMGVHASLFYTSVSSPVRQGDYGAYKALVSNALVGDDLEHDHIPSRAAVAAYLEDKTQRPIEASALNNVKNNATALEIPKSLHASGRTYRGRNTHVQIANDASDLRLTTVKDMAWHLYNSGGNMELIEPFRHVYIRNARLCLFE